LRNATILVLKLAVSIGLVWFAFSKIYMATTWSTLRSIAPAAILGALVLLFIQLLLGALRLRALLGALGARYRPAAALEVVLIGAFFSQTMISFVGGDAMRIWRIIRSRVSVATAAKSVLFDRVAGFAGLFVLLLAVTPFLVNIIPSPEMLAGQALIVLTALGGIVSVFVVRRIPGILPQGKVVKLAQEVVDSGLAIWRSPQGAWLVIGLSIAIQLTNVVVLYVIGEGLGIHFRFIDGLLLFPTVLFLSMLPISVAGWGVREGAMVTALGLVGVPGHQSLALSVCFGLCLVAISLPGGAVWLLSRNTPVKEAT
jgi:uncharacterized membrane protein YbhN (UPF0104 family)